MTCIIGLRENGKTYIGADSSAVGGLDIRIRKTPKVFRNDGIIIGYTSSFRMAQILQFMDIPQYDEPDEKYMVTKFIEAIRQEFKVKGFSTIKDNEETGGSFIVGVSGYIYQIDSDYQVQEYVDDILAVGCGRQYALGAMSALNKLSPRERILRSLEISAYYSGGVCAPFGVLET